MSDSSSHDDILGALSLLAQALPLGGIGRDRAASYLAGLAAVTAGHGKALQAVVEILAGHHLAAIETEDPKAGLAFVCAKHGPKFVVTITSEDVHSHADVVKIIQELSTALDAEGIEPTIRNAEETDGTFSPGKRRFNAESN